MNHLLREHAPITAEAWQAVENECKAVLELNLAARRVVDFDGPHGWSYSASTTGRTETLEPGPLEGVSVRRRGVRALIELEAFFEVSRAELEALTRGAEIDLSTAVEAATRLAHAEDHAVFHGYPAAGIEGIVEASEHGALTVSEDYSNYLNTVVEALEKLQAAGVQGPYAIVLGPRCYAGLLKASDPNGYPALKRLERLVQGPIVRAPALDGALVASVRGGDFELIVGQDLALGYDSHDSGAVRFRLLESLAFRVLGPEAAVPLVHGS